MDHQRIQVMASQMVVVLIHLLDQTVKAIQELVTVNPHPTLVMELPMDLVGNQ